MGTHLATVSLTQDNIERQARCIPERALEELIWNALDAGGKTVEVCFEVNTLGVLSALEVRDQGTGIPFEERGRAFGTIGESLKLTKRTTPDGRSLHGSEGRGRFKALVLGTEATWATVYHDGGEFKKYAVTIKRENQKVYSFADPTPASEPTGTRVRLAVRESLGVGAALERCLRRSKNALRVFPRALGA